MNKRIIKETELNTRGSVSSACRCRGQGLMYIVKNSRKCKFLLAKVAFIGELDYNCYIIEPYFLQSFYTDTTILPMEA